MICYNEEKLMQFVIDKHKKNFPNARIIIYDNESTDSSVEIAKRNGCEVRTFKTGGMDDGIHMNIKNSCWKEPSDNNWVLIADLDEIPQITAEQLLREEKLGTSIIKPQGYDFVGPESGFDLEGLDHLFKHGAGKYQIFNRRKIKEMNYGAGAHQCNPTGTVVYSKEAYDIYHYKWISYEYVRDRHKMYAARRSENNKKHNWSYQYLWSEEELRKVYNSLLPHLIKIK